MRSVSRRAESLNARSCSSRYKRSRSRSRWRLRVRSRKGRTRGRTWRLRCSMRVCADVGPEEGVLGPWWRDRTVRVGGDVVREEAEEEDAGVRRGWRARKATKGYVVAWSFSAAWWGVSGLWDEEVRKDAHHSRLPGLGHRLPRQRRCCRTASGRTRGSSG